MNKKKKPESGINTCLMNESCEDKIRSLNEAFGMQAGVAIKGSVHLMLGESKDKNYNHVLVCSSGREEIFKARNIVALLRYLTNWFDENCIDKE